MSKELQPYKSFSIPIFPDDLPPPPSEKPLVEKSVKAVDPESITFCKYRYTYIWLENGHSFWMWLTYVGPTSISGFIWIGFAWAYFGTDVKNINSFVCY